MQLTSNGQEDRSGEVASAMVMAIALMILSAGVVGVIVNSNIASSGRSGTALREQGSAWAADGAADKIRLALDGALMSDLDEYRLSQPDLNRLVDDAANGEMVLDNNLSGEVPPLFKNPSEPTGFDAIGFQPVEPFTMRQRLGSTSFGYWQVMRVQEPDYVNRMSLRVWIRAWTGSGQPITDTPDSKVMVAEYRPRYFTDYQMVLNGPLVLARDLGLDGPAHFNGFYPGITQVAAAGAQVTCDTSKGANKLTTSQGVATLPPSSGCTATGNERPLAFVNFRQTFDRMRTLSATDIRVRRFVGSGPWTVTLSGPGGSVEGPGGTLTSFTTPATQGLLFEGEVTVAGTTTGRITIAASVPPGQPGTGNIRLSALSGPRVGADRTGSTGPQKLQASVGLFAQANVIVDTAPSCLTDVDAAVMAQTGSVTLDPYDTLQFDTGNRTTCSGRLTFRGPVAGQRAPLLQWSWDTGGSFGYSDRAFDATWYERDAPGDWRLRYRDNPPPFAPSDETFAKVGWKPANVDCLTFGRPERQPSRAATCS